MNPTPSTSAPARDPAGAALPKDQTPAQPLCPGPGCIGRLALPDLSESDTSTTEIAIQNLVPKPGLTNAAIFLYDQNGLLGILCETLSDQQSEYINLADWNYIQPGFKGSAVISATAWEHPAFDAADQLTTNPVGLAAVIIERGPTEAFDTPGDHSAGSVAFPVTTTDHEPPTATPSYSSHSSVRCTEIHPQRENANMTRD